MARTGLLDTLGRPNVFTVTQRPGESLGDACAAAQDWAAQTHRAQDSADSDLLELEVTQDSLEGE